MNESQRRYYTANKERLQAATRQLRKRNTDWAREQLGGKCVDCGTTEGLEFDHKFVNEKRSKICNYSSSINKLTEEIKKCELRCKKCHRARSNKQLQLAWRLLTIMPEELQLKMMEHPPDCLQDLKNRLGFQEQE